MARPLREGGVTVKRKKEKKVPMAIKLEPNGLVISGGTFLQLPLAAGGSRE